MPSMCLRKVEGDIRKVDIMACYRHNISIRELCYKIRKGRI